MSKRMTQEELEKAKETYKKILDLMACLLYTSPSPRD